MSSNSHVRDSMPSPEEIAKLPPDGGESFNRLIFENSPYLLQHARNPVDWYPWGDEAFEKARRENKPVLLSIGYSTCHWCHVMARESFEAPAIAEVINRYTVPIKVDREERPDLDQIYMTAVQLMSGSGGWPMTVFLTADGDPFAGGTYFPPEDRNGRPGLLSLLPSVFSAWRDQPGDVRDAAAKLREAMDRMLAAPPANEADAGGGLSRKSVSAALIRIAEAFDPKRGGLRGAPKFPPHGALRLFFHDYRRAPDTGRLNLALVTLDRMALGGIRDYVGGGFHRYAVDERWHVPHFEKMLCDNAQLLRVYVDGWRIAGHGLYRRVAREIAEWILREMTDPRGGFYSAIDADSQGHEGLYYTWTRGEILGSLGPEDGAFFCNVYNVTEAGNFRDEASGRHTGRNIPYMNDPLEEIAPQLGLPIRGLQTRLDEVKALLLEARGRRERPHLDDKVLAAWNGLAIDALAYAGIHLHEPRYIAAAERAAQFIVTVMLHRGRLLRSWRRGSAAVNGYLDDYAFLANGLIALYEATGKPNYLDIAARLAGSIETHFGGGGTFFMTSDDHRQPIVRTRSLFDNAIPSGNGAVALAFVQLYVYTGRERFAETAASVLRAVASTIGRSPLATESLLLAMAAYLDSVPQPHGALPGLRSLARIERPVLTAELFTPSGDVAPGGIVEAKLVLTVAGGHRIYANPPGPAGQTPLTVSLNDESPFEIKGLVYPEGQPWPTGNSNDSTRVYRGAVEIELPTALSEEAAGDDVPLTIVVRYRACSESACMEEETITLEGKVAVAKRQI